MNNSLVAVVPARGGSKRIKDKNIRDFCGRPMIAHILSAAKEAGIFDKIHVSTDSPHIREVVEKIGFEVDFMRPERLADDHTPILPVIAWVLETYRAQDIEFSDACLLMPCSPLIEAADLAAGHAAYVAHGRSKPLYAVTPYPAPVEWAFNRTEEGELVPREPGMYATRSQDLKPTYFDSGTFAFFPAHLVLSASPPTDINLLSIVLPAHKAVDIDDLEDLALAEALYRGRLVSTDRTAADD